MTGALGGDWGEINSILQVMKPGKESHFLKGKRLKSGRTGTSAQLFCLSIPYSFTLVLEIQRLKMVSEPSRSDLGMKIAAVRRGVDVFLSQLPIWSFAY